MAPAMKYEIKQVNITAASDEVSDMQSKGWTLVEEMSRPLMSSNFQIVMILTFRRDP